MSDETTVRVPLTVEERAERADIMAGLLAEIAAVKRQKADQAEVFGEQIKALEARLQEHGNVLREGAEERRQMDLTFPAEQAAQALHDVAAAACTCEGGPQADVKSPTCPIHGVDAQPARVKCDGEHAVAVACADPECWLIEGPADDGPAEGAPVEAGYVPPAEAQVDVGAVEEPKAVSDFRAEKARRRARA
jgi:hypothetical protein